MRSVVCFLAACGMEDGAVSKEQRRIYSNLRRLTLLVFFSFCHYPPLRVPQWTPTTQVRTILGMRPARSQDLVFPRMRRLCKRITASQRDHHQARYRINQVQVSECNRSSLLRLIHTPPSIPRTCNRVISTILGLFLLTCSLRRFHLDW